MGRENVSRGMLAADRLRKYYLSFPNYYSL
jgi:hypothetical protein